MIFWDPYNPAVPGCFRKISPTEASQYLDAFLKGHEDAVSNRRRENVKVSKRCWRFAHFIVINKSFHQHLLNKSKVASFWKLQRVAVRNQWSSRFDFSLFDDCPMRQCWNQPIKERAPVKSLLMESQVPEAVSWIILRFLPLYALFDLEACRQRHGVAGCGVCLPTSLLYSCYFQIGLLGCLKSTQINYVNTYTYILYNYICIYIYMYMHIFIAV